MNDITTGSEPSFLAEWLTLIVSVPLLLAPGSAALIHFKARYGYKMGNPGAIEIPWKPGIGWADVALGWHKLGGSPRRNGNGKH